MGKIYLPDIWHFSAQLDVIAHIAGFWLGAAVQLRSFASDHQKANADIGPDVWDDRYANSYRQYEPTVRTALTDTADLCDSVGTQLDDIVACLDNVKTRLANSWWRATAYPYSRELGQVVFTVPDGEESVIRSEYACADKAKDDARDGIRQVMAKLGAIDISTSEPWANVAISGKTAWLSPSPTQTQPTVRIDRFGNSAYVSGTSDNERFTVSIDPSTGEIIITIQKLDVRGNPIGPETSYRLPPGTQVTINAGAGNDTVFVPPGTHISLRVLGGAGNDKIDARGTSGTGQYFGGTGNDRVEAGRGIDFLSGGAGDDYLDGGFGDDMVVGGAGMDTLYGLDGEDILDGGRDKDYLDGSAGNDIVIGGQGDDVVIGGRGDDRLFGGDGDDLLSAGDGTDSVWGDGGNDTAQAGRDDTVHAETWVVIEYDPNLGSYINVVGSPEFIARVQSDLDFMRSDTEGQHLLQQLEDDYNNSQQWTPGDQRAGLFIVETSDENGYALPGWSSWFGSSPHVVEYNPGWNFNYDPDRPDTTYVPPIIVLYHELGHVYQFGSGTAADGEYTSYDFNGYAEDYSSPRQNLEPQNVGLPYDKNGDGIINSDDAALPDPTGHDPRITENNMRDHLGYQLRLKY